MPNWQLYIALVLALIIGFWQGKRYQKKRQAPQEKDVNQYYIKGLNYLLNEQPDAAIDTFVQSLDVNSETLETHLALGKMLRKKGEVDRAIRIHQNLLARPGLSPEYSQQAEYELAVDFAKAGLFDRAESLLENLIQQEGEFKQASLKCLLDIYRDEKEWEQGLGVLQQLAGSRFGKHYEQWAAIRAQFCCELAEESLAKGDPSTARQWIKQALAYDKFSVRANIRLGELEIAEGNTKKGIQLLQRIRERSPEFLSEVLKPLRLGYSELGFLDKYLSYLNQVNSLEPQVLIDIEIAGLIAEIERDKPKAADYLARQLEKSPSVMGLEEALNLYLDTSDDNTKQVLNVLQHGVKKSISRMFGYQCQSCGYELHSMHWLCPSCKHWESVKFKAS